MIAVSGAGPVPWAPVGTTLSSALMQSSVVAFELHLIDVLALTVALVDVVRMRCGPTMRGIFVGRVRGSDERSQPNHGRHHYCSNKASHSSLLL